MRVTLGGRVFALADLDRITFEQTQYLFRHARAAGIDHVWPRDGESDEAYDHRLRYESMEAVDIPALLSGYLVPDGDTWSKGTAEETRKHLAQLTDPDEYSVMAGLAGRVAPDFFARALALFATFQLSSASASRNLLRPTAAS